MANYMVLFQIGPVQEFIRAARKTQDYWAGSFLLSYLNCIAMQALGEKNVVFPDLKNSDYYKNSLKGATFWKGVTDPAVYIPSVPNRFFGILADDPQGKLQKAKAAILQKWQEIATAVLGDLNTKIKSGLIDRDFWNKQITNRALEILYVWREWPAGEDYGTAYQETEALMGARKASRIFPALAPQVGYACSLCGLRVALGSSQVKTREQLRKWWQDNIQKKLTFRLREGEYLCAVCTVKRLYPEVVFFREADVPSTATMATISWQNKLQGLLSHSTLDDSSLADLKKKMQEFLQEVQKAAKALKEPETASLPAYFDTHQIPADQQLRVEGDWLLEDSYNQKERREKGREALRCLADLYNTIGKLVHKVNAATPLTPLRLGKPAKYLALITADGDSMGAFLAGCYQEKHQEISHRLQEFATRAVPEVLEKERPGFILYWGGDEGLALVSLADLLPALSALHESWETTVRQGDATLPTLSAGAVIFHHQYPLRQAIAEVFQTLEHAKELRTYNREKDAWAVQIIKRSGAPLLTRAHWHYEDPAIQPLQVLQDFIDAYQEEKLSPHWLAALQAEERALGDPPENLTSDPQRQAWWQTAQQLFNDEVKRLLHRQAIKKTGWNPETLVGQVQQLNSAISGIVGHENFSRYQDLKGLLHLSHYVAKGGGR